MIPNTIHIEIRRMNDGGDYLYANMMWNKEDWKAQFPSLDYNSKDLLPILQAFIKCNIDDKRGTE